MEERTAICTLQLMPMRSEPGHRYEMVNVILFGEAFRILESREHWHMVELCHDGYSGWIYSRKLHYLSGEFLDTYNKETPVYSGWTGANYNEGVFHPGFGSRLPLYTERRYQLPEASFPYTSHYIKPTADKAARSIVLTAEKYLFTPYLWGGRSLLGIDCSGLTQMTCRLNGINLPRDAWQQAEKGTAVERLSEATAGDLAFFAEKEKISHVGILTGDGHIIHASEWVRIDVIDENGIFNPELRAYTLVPKVIRRYL